MTDLHEVRVRYSFDNWPAMDDVAHQAAGRISDFSGAGFGERDLGWVCRSEIEAERIARSLRAIGLTVDKRPHPGGERQ